MTASCVVDGKPRAYLAAFDNEVFEGGTDPRNRPAVVDDDIEDVRRRIYYAFF